MQRTLEKGKDSYYCSAHDVLCAARGTPGHYENSRIKYRAAGTVQHGLLHKRLRPERRERRLGGCAEHANEHRGKRHHA